MEVTKPQPKYGWTAERAHEAEDRKQQVEDWLQGKTNFFVKKSDPQEIIPTIEGEPITIEFNLNPDGTIENHGPNPWAAYAKVIMAFTGVRRAIPTTVPGEIRVVKNDHSTSHLFDSPTYDTVYVGYPHS